MFALSGCSIFCDVEKDSDKEALEKVELILMLKEELSNKAGPSENPLIDNLGNNSGIKSA